MKSVAIIGGGITGLTAAFRLTQQQVPVTLYEASARVGGVIRSIREGEYLAEFGPNTLLETSPKINHLIRDLDLEKRRLYSSDEAKNRYLVRGGRPIAMPGGLLGFLRTPLFSPRAKTRLFLEPFVSPRKDGQEEALAQFVLRRLGQEFLDYAIDPLVAGIYAGDPARLSVQHAFPKIHALEQRYGSLIKGQILGAAERKRRAEVSKQDAKKVSFDEGLQVLTDTLGARLEGSARLRTRVLQVEQEGAEWVVTFNANGRDQMERHAAVLYAAPAYKAADIRFVLRGRTSLKTLGEIIYPPVASVVLGYRRQEVSHPLDGFGMLIPKREGFNILGTLFSSSLFPGRAPAGHVLLTSYIGGMRQPALAQKAPETLIDLTARDLAKILGISGKPVYRHCEFYPKAIPQYEVGYGRFKELMDRVETESPGFFLAGHFRHGVSLSDSLLSGLDTAERIHQFLDAGPSPSLPQSSPPPAQTIPR